MSYASQSHVAFGDTWTAALHNQMIDNSEACAVANFTTKGDLFAGTGSKAGARLAGGSDYWAPNYLASKSQGLTTAPGMPILKSTGYQSWSNSLAETDVCSATLPGGFLGTTQAVRFLLSLKLLQNSGSNSTLTVKLYYGATSAVSAWPSIANSGNPYCVECWGTLGAGNATNVQTINIALAGGNAAGGTYVMGTAAAAIDSTAAQTVKWTVTMVNATATQTVTILYAVILFGPLGVMA